MIRLQLSLRVSDQEGQPVPGLTINPHKDPNAPVGLLAPPGEETPRGEVPENLMAVTRAIPTPVPTPTPTPVPEPNTTVTSQLETDPPSPSSQVDKPPLMLSGAAAGYIKTGGDSWDFRYYVVDPDNHHVQMFGKNPFLGQWGSPGNGTGQFNRPSGVAIDPENG